MDGRKFYWLKLKRDFFKRHDIRIIEAQANGKDYILFYLKLLCESVDHEGSLRFSDTIPYNEEMLSTITNTNVDIVRNAVRIFTELGLMDVMDDGTFYMNEVNKMVGYETAWAEKKRLYRANQKMLEQTTTSYDETERGHSEDIVPPLSDKSKSKSKSIELDIKKESKPKKEEKRFVKPTVEDVEKYCKERGNGIDAHNFVDHYEANGWKVGKTPMKDWKAAVRTWERNGRNNKPTVGSNGIAMNNNWDKELDEIF